MKKRVGIILAILCFTLVPKLAFADTQPLCTYTFVDTPPDYSITYCEEHISDIHYVLIDFGVDSSVNAMTVNFNTYSVNNNGGRVSYLWEYSTMSISRIQAATGFSSTYPLTFSFYSSFPGPSCPSCPSCPDCENCDDPLIARLFKDGFWGVATALVSLIVPCLALFLVFRLVHDWLWGKG